MTKNPKKKAKKKKPKASMKIVPEIKPRRNFFI